MKKILLICIFLMSFVSFSFVSKKEVTQERDSYNIYLQSGDSYLKSDSNEFPVEGYILNAEESNCENGGVVVQDPSTKKINISFDKTEKCNLYFDKESNSTLNFLTTLNEDIKIKKTTPDFTKNSPLPSSFSDNGITSSETSYSVPVNTNYITYADSYTFNSQTGRYNLVNPQTCKWDECYSSLAGKYYGGNYLYEDSNIHEYQNLQKLFQITSSSTSTKIYYKSTSRTITYDDSDTGVFEMEDDYGESLYFRGNVTNNYFKFGKNSSDQDMYFRIIRINGNGTIRLQYDGTEAHDNGDTSTNRRIGTSKFNNGLYDNGYVGYMIGNFAAPTGCTSTENASNGTKLYVCSGGGSNSYEDAHSNINSSSIKTYLENWYEQNILNTEYADYVADEIFCNDRSMKTGNLGYKQNYTSYGPYVRLITNKIPSLKCPQKNDSFTVENPKGNAMLTYPVGLITADEIIMAGHVNNGGDYNSQSYVYRKFSYYTMSPYHLNNRGYARVFTFNTDGYLYYTSTSSSTSVIPVINLKSSVNKYIKGEGTKTNPFYIDMN